MRLCPLIRPEMTSMIADPVSTRDAFAILAIVFFAYSSVDKDEKTELLHCLE